MRTARLAQRALVRGRAAAAATRTVSRAVAVRGLPQRVWWRTASTGASLDSTHAVASPTGGSVADSGLEFPPAPEHAAFDVLRSELVPDYRCHVTLYQHKKTGGQVLSVRADEPNKVFGVSFRTPVSDSTGVPHVLEHSVLCGSEKYPLREPFVELLKSSVQTFLNAFTYPDRTCYPVSSQNDKDFYNLVDVYMDAVFHPRLTPQVLQQEGWHLEGEGTSDDPKLSYKGVVFNEMKGVFSQAGSVHMELSQSALFPDTTYKHCSGGDPLAIPDLTWEQFSGFHSSYYHPSNAHVFFFGNDDAAKRLDIVDEYFRDYETKDTSDSQVAVQKLWTEPRRLEGKYPASADAGDKHWVSLHWLMSEGSLSNDEHIAWVLLDTLLLGNHASPLIKTLIDSELGEDIIGGGCDDSLRQPTYSIGLKGVAQEHTATVEDTIMSVLQHYADHGFERDHLEAALNLIEFRVREPPRGGYGLGVMLSVLPRWVHYGDPVDDFYFEDSLVKLRETVLAEGSTLLQDLLRKHLLDNQHRLAVNLHPDPDFTNKREAQEKERLQAIAKTLSPSALDTIKQEQEALLVRQTTPDPPELLATVPTLELEDLSREALIVPREMSTMTSGGAATTVLTHAQPTRKILHFALGFDFRGLEKEYLPLMSIFLRCLRELPTAYTNEIAMSHRIDSMTGGIDFSTSLSPVVGTNDDVAAKMFVSGKALQHKVDDLVDIMQELLLHTDFNQPQMVAAIVREAVASKESALVSSGNAVVGSHLSSLLSMSGWTNAQMGGVPQLLVLRELLKRIETDWDSVRADFEHMRATLLSGSTLASFTADEETLAVARAPVQRLLDAVTDKHPPAPASATWDWTPKESDLVGTAFLVPTQVNYVGKYARLVDPTVGRIGGHTAVIDNLLRTGWLWEKVRVTGGAYGCSAGFDRFSGIFAFTSYRDPNLASTLQTYDDTSKYLRDPSISYEDIRKSIISTIGSLDSPMTPADKGSVSLSRFLAGITDEEVQRRRDEIFDTSPEDLRDFADRLEAIRTDGVAAAVTSHEALDADTVAASLLRNRVPLL